MDKVKITYKLPESTKIEYNGIVVEVVPFLGVAEQISLIDRYILEYFQVTDEKLIKESPYNYIEAEFNLRNYILQTCTNIDVTDLDQNIYVDENFWEQITVIISNYWDFRAKLDTIVEQIKDKNSLLNVVAEFIKNANDVIAKISEISPEQLEKLTSENAELFKKLESVSLIGKS